MKKKKNIIKSLSIIILISLIMGYMFYMIGKFDFKIFIEYLILILSVVLFINYDMNKTNFKILIVILFILQLLIMCYIGYNYFQVKNKPESGACARAFDCIKDENSKDNTLKCKYYRIDNEKLDTVYCVDYNNPDRGEK